MRRKLLVPVAVLVVLLAAAGGSLAATSLGSGGDDGAAADEHSVLPFEEGERDGILDRLLPELEPLLPRLRQQPFVGIDLRGKGGDVVVEQLVPGGPAARAGLHEGDVIEAVGDRLVRGPGKVAAIVRGSERGDLLTFHVRRDGNEREIEVRVGLRPVPFEPRGDGLRSLLLPDELLEFFALPNLRERLTELFERFVGASVTFLEDDGERVSLRVLAGTIAEVSDDGVIVAPNGGGPPQEFTITEQTHIVRGLHRTHVDDLKPGDRVVLVIRDESREALAILAFPAMADE